ncbi:hypothetical protein [Protofrankia coriariae]|uniref:Uncharacterized protein n=1 Tax=Protofrankia coriariae TaxID=1562887 RepID=A0ABR5EZG8_9ACTN|nr:hypothetical protein [Protofrankia coriariae]KLL09861.1 hypothetical protein FrCorBMG51_22050 [Protofrankia coriariae]ONH32696.1 hypothetical protein BL254_21410 [Protofrankia sp. BMG5.30]
MPRPVSLPNLVAPSTNPASRSRTIARTITASMITVVALSFLFSFGNVWALGITLGVPPYIAPLNRPRCRPHRHRLPYPD